MLSCDRPQRQGNVFTAVCDSVHRGGLCLGESLSRGGLYPGGGSLSRGGPRPGGVSVQEGGFCPGGVSVGGWGLLGGSFSRGSLSRGVSVQEDHQYGNVQALSIILECILVIFSFTKLISPEGRG